MEGLIETGFGRLPAQLLDDSDTLQKLIIDEIERSLPEIISRLEVPPPLDSRAINLLQYRLRSGRGFRPLTAVQRKQSIEQLQHQAFVKSLRKVQELASKDVVSANTRALASQKGIVAEGTNCGPLWTRAQEDLTEIRALEIGDLEERQSEIFGIVSTPSPVLQENASPEIAAESRVAQTVRELERQDSVLEIPDTPIELQEPVAGRDIRGLLALLRNGKLLAFLETTTKNLIPRTIEAIEVPDIKVYGALNLESLMSYYHELVIGGPAERSAELRLLDALIVSLENEAQWSRINKRRFHLITKKHSIGLDSSEIEELQELQRLADMHAESVQPLPFAELAMLKDYARKLGFVEGPVAP